MRPGHAKMELAQAVSELAALLAYRGRTNEAGILRAEATSLLCGGTERGRQEELQRARIVGGMETVVRMQLEPDERAIADRVVLRIRRAM